jgi:hypothetical protein
VLRTDWATIESADGQFDWSFLDAGMALGQAHNKNIGISVDAGVSSPAWIYSIGAKSFTLTGYGTMPAPWDPIFQSAWKDFLTQLAARYDSNPQLAFVTMAGPGRTEEYFFAKTAADVAELAAAGGPQVWVTAANQVTVLFATVFASTPFFCATGQPAPGVGSDMMTQVVNYGLSAYPERFGVQSNELTVSIPTNGLFPHTKINTTGLSPVGYQMLGTVSSGRLGGTLQQALTNGIVNGAQFIEVYDVDCEDPTQQSVISTANQQLLSTYP